MTLELLIFIAAILFGIILFWRESQGNKLYLFFNKMMNSKDLQMSITNKKGFIYQQNFLLRLVYISTFFLVLVLIARFIIPIDITTVSLFTSMIFGTLLGTYIAGFIFKSSAIIEEQSENLGDTFNDVLEKGKDFVKDLKTEEPVAIKKAQEEVKDSKVEEKSARERLKDKGLL